MTVEMLRTDTARIVPSLVRRVLFRETERIAICVAGPCGWEWRWDATDKPVDAGTARQIDRAALEARRRALADADLGNVSFLDVAREPTD